MKINSYLFFNGQCEAAFKFYEQCLGGEIVAMHTYAGSPAESQVPPEWRDKIMHVCLMVGEQMLMGSDGMGCSGEPAGISGFSVSLNVDTPAEAERLFNALAENGTVRMPMEQTFWAVRFGMLVDQYDVPWMINCEQAG